jgi:hypothetical protein
MRLALAGALAASAIGADQAEADQAVALLDSNTLIRFDTAAPGTVQSSVAVTGLSPNVTLRGIDVRPETGELYGVATTTATFNNAVVFTYRIDPVTGAATFVGSTGVGLPRAGDFPIGFDFDPMAPVGSLTDRMRYVSVIDENARLNPNDGALAGDDADLTPTAVQITAAAYDDNVRGATETTLYLIRRDTSSLAYQGGPNGFPSADNGVVTDIGPLGVTLTSAVDAGLDITAGGLGYAALTVGGSTGLYTLNPHATSAATLVGAIGTGASEVFSLAILQSDGDGDGLRDVADNCPAAANPDQADLDGDGDGDACDPDQDGDGLSDATEIAIGSDSRSTDSDVDGVGDGGDACPTLPGTLPNGCPDIALPETTITKGPKKKTTRFKATFAFTSTEAGSTFACSLDHKAFKPCTSPQKYKKLKPGRHSFEVRAIDAADNLDPTPAKRAWTVKD